jgi:signal peptidase I
MFKAFVGRRPWATALVFLTFGPVLGMLYLNRGRYALLYFLGGIAWGIAVLSVWPSLVSQESIGIAVRELPLHVLGATQGYFLARRWDFGEPLKWYSRWYGAFGIAIVLPFLLLTGVRTFLYRPFDLPSVSMEPNANLRDYLFVSRFAYNSAPPQRGDMIVFYTPRFRSYYVKRIIGMPGDRIQMKDGVPFINATPVRERRIADWPDDCGKPLPCNVPQFEETLPNGRHYAVLDRDAEGPLDNTEEFHVPAEAYFVMGDNRDNSDDSRTELGMIARGDITGRPSYKFMVGGHWTWQSMN